MVPFNELCTNSKLFQLIWSVCLNVLKAQLSFLRFTREFIAGTHLTRQYKTRTVGLQSCTSHSRQISYNWFPFAFEKRQSLYQFTLSPSLLISQLVPTSFRIVAIGSVVPWAKSFPVMHYHSGQVIDEAVRQERLEGFPAAIRLHV